MHPEAPCSKVLALLHIHGKLCTMLQNAKCYKRIHTPLLSFLAQQQKKKMKIYTIVNHFRSQPVNYNSGQVTKCS